MTFHYLISYSKFAMSVAEDLFWLVIAALILDSIGLGLRCWVRIKLLRFFGYDDVVLCLSFVSIPYIRSIEVTFSHTIFKIGYILFAAFTFVALHYGYGVMPVKPWHDSKKAIEV